MKTRAWTAAAAIEVWPEAKIPRDPGGSVRRIPGLKTKNRTAKRRWYIAISCAAILCKTKGDYNKRSTARTYDERHPSAR